ncbi:MAG: outer membrane beta-barrel family protein [Chitinophagales bacterium]
MKKHVLAFTIIFYFFLFPCFGQDQYTISGTVEDESESLIPYAAIALHSTNDSVLLSGTTSDLDGFFELKVNPGTYFLKISFLSYEDEYINVEIKDQSLALGRIILEVSSTSLEEVWVQGEKSQMELRLDKKVFNIGKDLSTAGSNGADILDKVPSVNVDLEGNITLRGSGNVRILVNGKPSGLVNSGDPQSLRQLQGNLIQSVEVITNPSAKYDAEGEVGIINIVLKEQVKKGVNGSFDFTTGYPHDHSAAANLNFRSENVNFFISEGISYRKSPGGGTSLQSYFLPDTTYAFERLYDQSRSDLSNNFRLGADFFVTSKDIITLSGLYQYSTGKNLSTTTYRDINEMNQIINTVERYQDEYENEHEVEFDLNYKKEFAKKDQEFSIDIKFNLSQDREEADYDEDDLSTGTEIDVRQRSDNLEYQKMWLFQTDYAHPFGKKGVVETGFKATLRNFDNDFLVEEEVSDEVWEALDRFDNQFKYLENIYALYFLAGEQWGNFSAKAGLRMEYSDISTKLVKTNENNPRNYIDFFPSAFFGYKIKEKNTLQLSYSRRLSRPGFWSLLPFFQYADTRNYFSGNPNLNPEYTHSMELGYQRYLKNGTFLGSIYYRYKTGIIERITFLEEDGITRSIPINLSDGHDYGFEISLNYDFFDWWTATGNMNAYRSVKSGVFEGVDYGSDTYAMNFQISTKFTVAKILDLQPSFNYRSKEQTAQGIRKASYALDFGAGVEVLKGKGKLTLSVTDIFNTRRRRWISETDEFRIEGDFRFRQSRQVKLSFNYILDKKK